MAAALSHMQQIAVQTLDGHRLQVLLPPASTVKDLRRLLQQQHGLAKCALFLNARQLQKTTCLSELLLGPGDCVTALTTRGAAVAAASGERQQQQQPSGDDPAAPPPTAAAANAGPASQHRQLDTLLPGYASRPHPSPVKKPPPPAASLDAAAAFDVAGSRRDPLSAEGCLSGGGFILSQQGRAPGADDAAAGRLPAPYRTNRKRQGRTLLQEHMLQQQDLKEAAAAEARRQQQQQQQRQEQGQQGQQQREHHLQQAVVAAEAQQQVNKRSRQEDAGSGCSAAAPAAGAQQAALAAAAAPPPDPPLPPPPAAATAAAWDEFKWRLQQPASWSRSESSSLLALPLPAVLRQLLLLHSHLATCYSFLLQQRIQPRWASLLELMQGLFPQDQFSLHHVIAMAQLAPGAVLLLQEPNEEPPDDQQQAAQQYAAGSLWQPTLTEPEVQQLQQQLAAAAEADADADANAQGHQGEADTANGQGPSCAGGASSGPLPVAAAALEGGVSCLRVLLLDPGPPAKRKSSRTATAAAASTGAAVAADASAGAAADAGGASDGGEPSEDPPAGGGIAAALAAAQQLPPGGLVAARAGSGSRAAATRRQRLMRSSAVAAAWLVHEQFLLQQQQRVPADEQCWRRQSTADEQQQQQQEPTEAALEAPRKRRRTAGGAKQQRTAGGAKQQRTAGGAKQQQQQEEEQQPTAAEVATTPVRRSQRLSSRSSRASSQQQQQDELAPTLAPSADSSSDEEYAPSGQQAPAAGSVGSKRPQGPNSARGARARGRASSSSASGRRRIRAAAGAQTGGSSWDALLQRSWHSLFDVELVSLQDALTAVAQHQRWLRQQQQQQQQQAHTGEAAAAAASSAGGAVSGRQLPVVLARPTRKLARHKCCTTCQPLTAPEFLEHLQSLPWYQQQVAHVQPCPARAARYGQPLTPLAPSTRAALAARGISQLFCHQAAAVDALCAGQQHVGVVVATSTASGKSLCYNIPLLEALARDRSACALYLFPTKALAQDQLKALQQLLESAFGGDGGRVPAAEVYDGDTPHAARPAIRERAQLLITNPDMLHQSILPFHQSFSRLLGKLALVVVDEGHAYTGVFGSHTALVLRRLRRLCEATYGSSPRFVTTSATIANPLEQAALLLGLAPQQLLLVDDDGSPHGPKNLCLWNPPLTPQAAAAADAAGAGDQGAVVLSHTERRAGGGRPSSKLQRDMARGLAREANAARRRGVALSAAAGVTEQEWLAAVKLGRAAGAAKAFLFGKKGQGKQAAAVASCSSGAAALGDGSEEEPDQEQEGLDAEQQQQQEELDAGDTVDELCLDGQPDALPSAAAAAGDGTAKPRYNIQVAKAALASVAGAAAPQQSGRGSSYKQAPPRYTLKQPSSALASGAAAGACSTLRASGSSSSALPSPAAAARSALQRDIEAALPARGSFKERFGAAGTPLDQQRESPIVEMSLLLAEAVMHGLRTIAFCKSRRLCELVAAYTRENLLAAAPDKAGLVKVYRGGYSPSQRRQIEADLHNGALTAVAATNALELGVDVGGLDLTLHLGFPGSVASLWQQAGRAGRRNQPSVSVYVGFDGPLDQHFMQHPQELLARPIESVQLDPFNSLILAGHLCCAARELPVLLERDAPLFGGPAQLQAAMAQLQSQALLMRHPHDSSGSGGLAYCGPAASPAADISLRTIDPERFVIYNSAAGAVLEEVEANTAFYHIYDGAIYLHQGRPFIVTSLNLETRVALVRPVAVKWYTKVRDHTDIHVTGGRVAYPHTAHSALAAIAARRSASRGQLAAAAAAACARKEEQDGAVKQEPAEQCQQPAGVQCKQEVKEEGPYAGLPAGPSAAQAGRPDSQGAVGSAPQPPPSQECKDGGAGAAAAAVPGGAAGVLASRAVCESCVITVRFLGYYRLHQGRGEIFDAVDLFLPDTQFETQACYMRLPPAARRACEAQGVPFREAVHAASHALLNVMPLLLVCNPADLGTECDNPYDTRFRPERLLLFDKHPGGIGLAAQATPLFSELLQRALQLVEGCSCGFVKGCPRCVQHLECKNYNAVLHKEGALLVLRAALEAAAPVAAAAADAAQ